MTKRTQKTGPEAVPAALARLERITQPQTRFLGLDVGSKTVGLALCDRSRRIATPLKTLKRVNFADTLSKLRSEIEANDVGALIVGLPLNMNGTEGPRAQATRAFMYNLEKTIDLPVAYWDERLSTAAVTRTMLDADLSRKRRAELVDKMAASFILQGALDFLANRRDPD